MTMIIPTVGRVVLLRNRPGNPSGPEAVLIAHVNSHDNINVGGFDRSGQPIAATSVPLLQASEPKPGPGDGIYAEWMPYQVGQAAKTEAAEASAAAVLDNHGRAPAPTPDRDPDEGLQG